MLRKRFIAAAVALLPTFCTGCPVANDSGVNGAPRDVEGDTGFPAPSDSFERGIQAEFPGCDEPAHVGEIRAKIFELVNEVREIEGLEPLQNDLLLQNQASQYACEMIDGQFFGHVNPVTGSTLSLRANEFGYDYYIVGENLAGGQPTPEQAFADWMASPSHRANILDPRFTEMGVGVRTGGYYGIYYVQEFGHPR